MCACVVNHIHVCARECVVYIYKVRNTSLEKGRLSIIPAIRSL